MDKTDLILSQYLLADSRVSYRELADRLGLSVNAVHKRIQAMIEAGIIRAFTTRLRLDLSGGITVLMFGKGEGFDQAELRERIQATGDVYWLAFTGADHLIVGAYLKGLAELDAHIRFVKEVCRMDAPFVGLMAAFPPPGHAPLGLTKLDHRIVAALHRDSRKTVAQIATELGQSAKVVRRRLSAMEEAKLLDYSIEWYPDAASDIMTLFQVLLAPGAEVVKVGFGMHQGHSPNILFPMIFNNSPDMFFAIAWTPTTKELKQLWDDLGRHEGVRRVVPNIIYSGLIFDTWRDREIDAAASTEARR